MSIGSLVGRNALVTGASRGIGRAIAERLAEAGARVVVAARNQPALEQVAESLGAAAEHLAVAMDVSDAASIEAALALAQQRVGRVDVLVCNAGIAHSEPYHRTDDEMWDHIMSVNATSVLRLCRPLIPPMIEAGWGRVVIVASNAGLTGYAYSSAYCASKHAALGFMRAVALEIALTPVTINALCPGWVATEMAEAAVQRIADTTGKSLADARGVLERMSPQQRMVAPAEVAQLVTMLCREDACGIHGQALAIDGGQVMR